MRSKKSSIVVESAVARMVTQMLNSSEKTQEEICTEVGLSKSNILTMFKQGRTKLPIKYVVPLSKAVGQDPKVLMQTVLEEYFSDILVAMGQTYGTATSKSEQVILDTLRRAKAAKEKDLKQAASKSVEPNRTSQRCRLTSDRKKLDQLFQFAYKNLVE